ncbi:hypothetical protein [Marinomonas sp. THO17]|uniref:hypothetical protein n=1 Tax=Marinomonas sp. THO17 TaxID=3149048 RepID=UPI00336BCF05
MKKAILPLGIALSFAIGLHLLVLELSQPQLWLPSNTPPKTTELFLLKSASQSSLNNKAANSLQHDSPSTPLPDTQQGTDQNLSESTDMDLSRKPNLLKLDNMASTSKEDTILMPEVFSNKLREQIEQAKKDQQAYLKGQLKETEYQITEDADGTKYVNIEGVCWRIPEPGSEQAWAIVLAGCNGQTDTFHFEFNIDPRTFLGSDAIFPINE